MVSKARGIRCSSCDATGAPRLRTNGSWRWLLCEEVIKWEFTPRKGWACDPGLRQGGRNFTRLDHQRHPACRPLSPSCILCSAPVPHGSSSDLYTDTSNSCCAGDLMAVRMNSLIFLSKGIASWFFDPSGISRGAAMVNTSTTSGALFEYA